MDHLPRPFPDHERWCQFLQRLASEIYTPVAPLEITAWRTPEPVPFQGRQSGEKLCLQVGDIWGRRLFDCAWFRFGATLPHHAGEELFARIDINGELYIADDKGMPVRGLTCIDSVFERKLGTPAKTIYRIPREAICKGRVELWADAAFNDLFGSLPNKGRVRIAEVCRCRSDIRALYYDLEVLIDYWAGLEGELHETVGAVLSKAAALLEDFDPASVSEARKILAPLFADAPKKRLRVSAVGHAHLDLAWLWPIRETIRKGARTFATALYNIERYPEYIYGVSQPQLFVWMQEHYPELYGRIKGAVAAGRVELQGTFWIEPDCNIPNGESFVRQILHGAAFFEEEFGILPRFCWEPDVFGYNAQLPQILRKSGHDYFMTQKLSWNVVNRFPHHSFRWEGIDGTSILAHMLAEETYGSPAAPHSLKKIATEYAEREISGHALLVYGIGDGGGGPDAEHLERLRRVKHLRGLPDVEHRTVAEFFKLWAVDGERFPRWRGELYLERHQGTYTTQALTKRYNRLSEIALRDLEWVSVLARELAGMEYPAGALDRIWKEVLLYQFHDILPGSSIKRVYDECNARQALILQGIESMAEERFRAVADKVGGRSGAVVFNSLPWAREEWLQLRGQWHRVNVPAMGWAAAGPACEPGGVGAGEGWLENEHLKVTFGGSGEICSILQKETGREVLDASARGNDLVVYEDSGDAWDFANDLEKKDVWVYLRQTCERPTLVKRKFYTEGPCAVCHQTFSYRSSTIEQKILLRQGAHMVEFETRADWADSKRMLRVRFPVAVKAAEARFEIPFGSIHRSTGDETLVERAQIEVPAQQWVDLADQQLGVTLLNDCKYGFRVKGNTLDMCLLRSVPHPGNALIGKDNVSGSVEGQECTDLGEHRFRYALCVAHGRQSEAELTRLARAFNVPLRVVERKPSDGAVAQQESWLKLSNAAIEVSAVKQAEKGGGCVVRLVNVMPTAQGCVCALGFGSGSVEELDLVEKPLSPPVCYPPGREVALEFGPFEVKTLVFK